MRVLLLGATGNLGLRLIPALLSHNHILVAFVRSAPKLQSLVPPPLISQITITVGDATDVESIQRALLAHNCDAIVDVAGNQVPPWREPLLPKIAKSVADAAVAVGLERGKPLRAWLIGGINSLQYPGTEFLVQDFMPNITTVQHQGTLKALEAVPVSALRWSLLCVAMMRPASSTTERLDRPRNHQLLISASSPPAWEDHWVRNIPVIGLYLNLIIAISTYTTELEDVADFLAEDLESGSLEWVGAKVGMKQRRKVA